MLFKGKLKKMVPSILKDLMQISYNSSTSLDKYGQVRINFEYLAAGRAIIQTYTTGYSLLEKYTVVLVLLIKILKM